MGLGGFSDGFGMFFSDLVMGLVVVLWVFDAHLSRSWWYLMMVLRFRL